MPFFFFFYLFIPFLFFVFVESVEWHLISHLLFLGLSVFAVIFLTVCSSSLHCDHPYRGPKTNFMPYFLIMLTWPCCSAGPLFIVPNVGVIHLIQKQTIFREPCIITSSEGRLLQYFSTCFETATHCNNSYIKFDISQWQRERLLLIIKNKNMIHQPFVWFCMWGIHWGSSVDRINKWDGCISCFL